MKAIVIAILKKVGTTILLNLLEEATDILKGREDNDIGDAELSRLRQVKLEHEKRKAFLRDSIK